MVDELKVGDGCSVSGTYSYEDARIVVGRSPSRRRQFFTALHEFGHHLQQREEESVVILEDEPDDGVLLEDDVCDGFAAEVLMPDGLLRDAFSAKGPTAADVVDLFDATHASREACCVRAVQRLRGQGYVMLCDLDGVAVFSATNTPYPVRRGTPQLGNKVIEAALRWRFASREARVTFPSGWRSPKFFGDARVDGDYVFGVFVEHMPPWVKGLTPSIEEPNGPLPPGTQD